MPEASATDAGAAPRPTLVLIAAVARHGVIGDGERMPWHLPEDLAHFKRETLGCPVIMGRRTWDSLPARLRPLPGRLNLVVSRNAAWSAEGAIRCGSLDEAIDLAAHSAADGAAPATSPRVFVIGGGQLYAQALPRADELVLTEIEADVEGSVRFPAWTADDFERVSHQPGTADASGWRYAFNRYRRRSR